LQAGVGFGFLFSRHIRWANLVSAPAEVEEELSREVAPGAAESGRSSLGGVGGAVR
jgi:hypothetical protein